MVRVNHKFYGVHGRERDSACETYLLWNMASSLFTWGAHTVLFSSSNPSEGMQYVSPFFSTIAHPVQVCSVSKVAGLSSAPNLKKIFAVFMTSQSVGNSFSIHFYEATVCREFFFNISLRDRSQLGTFFSLHLYDAVVSRELTFSLVFDSTFSISRFAWTTFRLSLFSNAACVTDFLANKLYF